MRIAFMSWRDLANEQAGGSEVFVDRLAVELQQLGHQVIHLCGGPVGRRSYPVVDMGGTFTQYLRAPLVHRRTARDWDLLVDVENGLPYFSPLWRRKPVLAFVHHVHRDQWDHRFPAPLAAMGRFTESKVMPAAYRRVPFATASSSSAAALQAIGIERDRIHLVNYGVDPPLGEPAARASQPLFVCLGRLVPHKRVDLLLRAWAAVHPVVGGELVVVGDGPSRASLAAAAPEGVRFAGRVETAEKWRLLRQAWILLHPAQHEGWGIAIIEAASVGTPALGFDVDGVRDAIVDGSSGRLVTTEEDLVRRWIEITLDQAQRERLSAGARAHAAGFGWERSARRFADIAEAVTDGPLSRSSS